MKRILIITMVAIMLFVTACGGQTATTTETEKAIEKVTEKAIEGAQVDPDGFVGKWIMIAFENPEGDVMAGSRDDIEDGYYDIEIKDDNTAVYNIGGTVTEWTWEEKDGALVVTTDGTVDEFMLEDGMLVLETEGMKMYYYKDDTEPSEKEQALYEAGQATLEKMEEMEAETDPQEDAEE